MPKRANKKQPQVVSMPLVNPNAGGIDVGDMLLAVAVPAGRDEVSQKNFGAFTEDLEAIVGWFKKCGVDTIAMECTGIYWKNIYTVLTQHGFEVCLANARHTVNITGRKTDESDAQWIQRLHSCGLLKSSFLPDDLTSSLRTLTRHRKNLTQDSTRSILRMQKAMELMNIKLHAVISNITGKTGTAIINAILAGERKAENFLPLVGKGIKADRQNILKSLKANWRDEYLFLLEQSWNTYLFMQQQIALCDKQIEKVLQSFACATDECIIEEPVPIIAKTKSKKHPAFNTRGYLQKIHGVDVMNIYGINETSALQILAETGTGLSKWPTEKHFVSWLNLCPNNKMSGGKLVSSQLLKKKPNAAALAFRTAANALCRSNNWLGDYFRRMKTKGGQKFAIVAVARKLAIIYYRMIRFKESFKPFDNEEYKQKCQRAKIAYLERSLAKLKAQVAIVI